VRDPSNLQPGELDQIFGVYPDWRGLEVCAPISAFPNGHVGRTLGSFFVQPTKIGVGTCLDSGLFKYMLTYSAGNITATRLTGSNPGDYWSCRSVSDVNNLTKDEVAGLLGSGWHSWKVIPRSEVLAA